MHLNTIDPDDLDTQRDSFRAAGISVAALLHHEFLEERYRISREWDPIVGVSFTGLFDFFVHAFGVEWLQWWAEGRPDTDDGRAFKFRKKEAKYLEFWKAEATKAVWEYCDRHGLKRPNRCTTVQPSGTKALLTGASPGWHPPVAQRFIRRITFRRDDPIAKACMQWGYSIVPSQSDKDENGNLLDDPMDPRCTEWLVEIPTEVSWANLPGADQVDLNQFTALAQFDFYMQVQNHYTAHNCFSRKTRFLTSEGVKSFEEFQAGDSVTVLDSQGDWSEATVVRTNDLREMFDIRLVEGKTGKTKVIRATACHRWDTRRPKGGLVPTKVTTTSQLKPGHRLIVNVAELPSINSAAIVHGLVYGDGSRTKNKKGVYEASQIYLCHARRELTAYFSGYSRQIERDDVNQTRIYGLPVEYKDLPSDKADQAYVAGFIAGLLASDGNISASTILISTSDEDTVSWLLENAPRIGIKVTGHSWSERSGYESSRPNCQIRFSKATFPSNLILRDLHASEFYSKDSKGCQWRVSAVEKVDVPEEGWCVMEPKTNHFTLEDNILTWNTSATISVREHEIEPLADRIYQAIQDDEGYISAALLARFDALETFPRLPFEPIGKAKYDELQTLVEATRSFNGFQSFAEALEWADRDALEKAQSQAFEAGPVACDSEVCQLPLGQAAKQEQKH